MKITVNLFGMKGIFAYLCKVLLKGRLTVYKTGVYSPTRPYIRKWSQMLNFFVGAIFNISTIAQLKINDYLYKVIETINKHLKLIDYGKANF